MCDMTEADRQFVAGWVAGVKWFQKRFSDLCIEAEAPEIARATLVVNAEETAARALARVGKTLEMTP